jgi:hypothetical protein
MISSELDVEKLLSLSTNSVGETTSLSLGTLISSPLGRFLNETGRSAKLFSLALTDACATTGETKLILFDSIGGSTSFKNKLKLRIFAQSAEF